MSISHLKHHIFFTLSPVDGHLDCFLFLHLILMQVYGRHFEVELFFFSCFRWFSRCILQRTATDVADCLKVFMTGTKSIAVGMGPQHYSFRPRSPCPIADQMVEADSPSLPKSAITQMEGPNTVS